MIRPGPHHIGTTGAVAGDGLVFDPDADEYGPGPVVQGLTSGDGTVTIGDNGDGTLDLATTGGGGGGGLTVQDENGNVATGVTQIDFQGAGVTAAAGTGEVVVTIPGGGGSGAGGVLACTSYNPGTLATKSPSTTSADVDATNLAATFTVPGSGKVLVVLNALVRFQAPGVDYYWNLRAGAADVSGSRIQAGNQVSGSNSNLRVTAQIQLTGLTPGASLTWKWGHQLSAAGTVSMFIGGVAGPATMTIHALP